MIPDRNRFYQRSEERREVRLLPGQLPQPDLQHHLQAESRLHEGCRNEGTLKLHFKTTFFILII